MGVNLHDCHIGLRIGPNNAAFIFFAVRQGDHHFPGAVHHMVIGEHITVLADDDSRPIPFWVFGAGEPWGIGPEKISKKS